MFIERLLAQGPSPVLERVVRFAAARHDLILENIANVDTPGYRQRDLSVADFQAALARRIDDRRRAGGPVRLDDLADDPQHLPAGILFHDGNNRSMEQLATDLAKNAMMHNVAIELLRKQFMQMEMALKERVV